MQLIAWNRLLRTHGRAMRNRMTTANTIKWALVSTMTPETPRHARHRIVLGRIWGRLGPVESKDSFASLFVAGLGDREDPWCVGLVFVS